MGELETNIFPITNLSKLSSQYQLYRVKGLSPSHKDYYPDRQTLQKRLSYHLQNPVLVVETDSLPHVVVRSDMQYDLPPRFTISKGKAVTFEKQGAEISLDYTERSPLNDAICLRFLQFAIQGEIHKYKDLWQTESGSPFFKKIPSETNQNRERFSGFVMRPIPTHDGGIGLCLDITSKTLSRYPLPTHIPLEQSHKWRGQYCIYRYGIYWYEIQISSLSDVGYSEHLVPIEDGKFISLQEFITRNAAEPLPPSLAEIAPDASVVVYYNNRDEERAAPTPLCYPVYGTDDDDTGKQHGGAILQPDLRREYIHKIIRRYFQSLKLGDTTIQISPVPLNVPKEVRGFLVPDLRFGKKSILSVRQTEGAYPATLETLGQRRLELLMSEDAGFFVSKSLDPQYLILPLSVDRSWGKQLIQDLKMEVNRQYPEGEYDPQVLHYDDSGKKTFVEQGRKFRKFIRSRKWNPGFALVVIHHADDKKLREEDQLEAMVIRELRNHDVYAAVIHSKVGKMSYEYSIDSNGNSTYRLPKDKRKLGRLIGYLRNVALNKVLLTNWRWPFVLDTPLHADIIIGLDVKNTTAGLVVVNKRGDRIRTQLDTTKHKEKLLDGQLRSYFKAILMEETTTRKSGDPIRHIVVHRDGIAYDTEIKGIKVAIQELKNEELLPQNAELTILEIGKTSMVSVRLFDVLKRHKRSDSVINPQVGDHYIPNGTDAYLCSTGRAFDHGGKRKGTVNPLHITYVEGSLEIEKCLEDIYALTCLAWTRPEDCSRYPITVRLNDRFLKDEATRYDTDALDFSYEEEREKS